eukprot:307579-Pyramimonas_sp.AAC.2
MMLQGGFRRRLRPVHPLPVGGAAGPDGGELHEAAAEAEDQDQQQEPGQRHHGDVRQGQPAAHQPGATTAQPFGPLLVTACTLSTRVLWSTKDGTPVTPFVNPYIVDMCKTRDNIKIPFRTNGRAGLHIDQEMDNYFQYTLAPHTDNIKILLNLPIPIPVFKLTYTSDDGQQRCINVYPTVQFLYSHHIKGEYISADVKRVVGSFVTAASFCAQFEQRVADTHTTSITARGVGFVCLVEDSVMSR